MKIRNIANPTGGLVRVFPQSIPSPDEIKAAMTAAGGWTKAQLAEWGVPWTKDGPPRGWKRKLEKAWREQNKIEDLHRELDRECDDARDRDQVNDDAWQKRKLEKGGKITWTIEDS
jgi:hypothetical protein